ncbi:class I SAM-dependent methyltransferase [Marinibaculum pumilum]|uniref:Class I SAM-dependent methyltransferase n=1 Tax=Marinibaculum pumilum TaxID=1766165 RepID=A0ABV7KTY4_9PROT
MTAKRHGPAKAPPLRIVLARAAAAERAGRVAEAVTHLAGLSDEARRSADAAPVAARVLDRAGRTLEALDYHCAAWQAAPLDRRLRQALATALGRVQPPFPAPELEAALLDLAAARDVEIPATAPLGMLQSRSPWRAALSAAAEGRDADLLRLAGRPAPAGFADDGFVLGVMEHLSLPGEGAERLLTGLRRAALLAADAAEEAAEEAALPPLRLLAALALQAWWAEYCWAETPVELAALERLGAGTAGEMPLRACLRALYRVPEVLPAAAEDDELALLRRACLEEPAAEAALAAGLPCLTGVADATSRAVQAQYEENPYPRWQGLRRQKARPLADVVTGLFPWVKPKSLPRGAERPRILVAGCGTGAHAAKVAARYRQADVLAVDLSARALGYGVRRASELGAGNLRFAVADILELGVLEERFHLIECSGVLHHLADPLAGWRVLRGLLRPRGLMKIGLYATAGRREIQAARDFVAAGGYPADAAGMRRARADLLALPSDAPARQVARELDFYAASTCRDLLFHVQEVAIDIPQLAAWLAALDLEFIGFEIADPALSRRFRQAFPAAGAAGDLEAWRRFEEIEPAAFRTMYQFWCRPRDG